MKDKVEIFVLSHNRFESVVVTIKSILAQNSNRYRLVVSENSDLDIYAENLKTLFPGVEIRRRPSLDSKEHFRKCISEVQEKYFCLFHDDDVMHPDFVSEVIDLHDKSNFMAVATNALVKNSLNNQVGVSFHSKKKVLKINSKNDLLKKYFSKNNRGIAPFPSYVYRKEYLAHISDQAGKYWDVLFCMQATAEGGVAWINKKLMTSIIHENNDGGIESLAQRLSLLAVIKHDCDLDKKIIRDYRLLVYRIYLNNNRLLYKHSAQVRNAVKKIRFLRRFGF